MLPRRASPAAIVVERCQRSNVSRSGPDRTMCKDDVRPRAIMISSHRCGWCRGRDMATRLQSQAIWIPFHDELY
jgi:hypothetical protein